MKNDNKILDLVAAVSPWLAPFIPAYFAAYNAYNYLVKGTEWYDVVAVAVIALTVETIGLSGVHTAIQFWNWNKTKNKSDDAAPLGVAIIAVVAYVVIIITVNAVLDYARVANPASLPYVEIFAVSLLSLLALNSALIVALRYGQSFREIASAQAKQERKDARKVTGKNAQNNGNFPVSFDDFRKVPESEYEFIARAATGDICARFGVTERTARNWRKSAAERVTK